MKSCIVYLASPLSFIEPTQPELSRFEILKTSLRTVKKHLPGLPIIIFHEDYSIPQFDDLKKIIPDITFETIDFKNGGEGFVYRKREKGYMMMCRFFCGELQNHPLLQSYDYYIRMDDDSFFIPPTLHDRKHLYTHDYTYRSLYFESHDQSTLYLFTKSFLEKKKLSIDYANLKRVRFLKHDNTYSGLAIYNNFHVATLSMWKNPLVKEYLDLIEKQHGILGKMWLDSNIHGMITFMLAPVCGISVSCLGLFGYRHNRHFSVWDSSEVAYSHQAYFIPKEDEI